MSNLDLEVEFEVAETATTALRDHADFAIFLAERSPDEGAPRCVPYFQVDDVDVEYRRLERNGVEITHAPQSTLWGYARGRRP